MTQLDPTNRNPQADQMADESMVRNLAAQAEAIWPQEAPLFARYSLPERPSILDVACGTGEISHRLLELFRGGELAGVDLVESHLALARERTASVGARARFEVGDAYALPFRDATFDLVVCRHLLQAIPDHARVLGEMARVTRPGGWLHVVAEDYAMMHFDPMGRVDTDLFWHRGPIVYAEKTGSDLRSGRKIYGDFVRLGLNAIRVDYVTIDTLRVPREVFSRIWVAWRDGYAEAVAEHSSLPLDEVRAAFDEMIAAIHSPEGYAVWHLPVISGRIPTVAVSNARP